MHTHISPSCALPVPGDLPTKASLNCYLSEQSHKLVRSVRRIAKLGELCHVFQVEIESSQSSGEHSHEPLAYGEPRLPIPPYEVIRDRDDEACCDDDCCKPGYDGLVRTFDDVHTPTEDIVCVLPGQHAGIELLRQATVVHHIPDFATGGWVLGRIAIEEVVESPTVDGWQWVQGASIVMPCLCFDFRSGRYGHRNFIYADLLTAGLHSEPYEVYVGWTI